MGASLRDISAADLEGTDIYSVAIARIEEVEAHFRNQHDGPGFYTNNRIKCRHHNSNETSTIYWDCPKMIEDLQDYLKQNYIEKIHEKIVTEQSSSAGPGIYYMHQRGVLRCFRCCRA